MILVSVLRTEQGFLTRLGLGVVMIHSEQVFRQRVGLLTGRKKTIESRYGEITKTGERSFLVKIKKHNGTWFEQTFKTFDSALSRLSAVEWVAG